MLPYNTGKYHETPEGVPMLHAVDHSLTETMLVSLSPSSQFMYEPEVMESTTCGQPQGSAGPPAFEPNSGENFLVKSENMISPTVEGLTFQDCVDPDELFSPPVDGLVFSDCLQLNECSETSAPGAVFADVNKQTLFGSLKGLEFIDYEKLQNVFAVSLDGVSYDGGGQKTGSFDMMLDEVVFDDRNRLDPLIPSTSSELGGDMKVEGIGNDWFELDKDIYEMSKEDAGGLLQDPVFIGGGPTLTQLNSKDLDSAGLLDDYNLEDLYADAFASDDRQGTAPPSASVDLAAVISKFPVGVSGAASTSPKFTTCTVTSFVTSVSTSGTVLPQQYPAYVANELLTGQEPCYSDYGLAELKQKLLTQSQWASLFAAKSGLASIQVNPCYVPVLRSGSQVSDVIGAVVVSGDGSLSLAVSEDPVQTLDKQDSANFIRDESWKEIERLLLSQNSGTQPADQNISGTVISQSTIKTEPHDTRIISPEELTDKESVFDDSDVENADDVNNNSDEDEFVGKSDNPGGELNASDHKDKKYFWQYNTQSKGPKGKRLCKSVETEDPHVLHDFEDPVFDPDQNQTRYKHNGKARRGDGNDVTPNPHKLFVTGNELKKLNRLINGIAPSSEMPASARAKMLKEKNKYASRACRLKKKAQHEANKLKLHGLEREHRQLMKILISIKKDIVNQFCNHNDPTTESLSSKLETLINKNLTLNVAGRTAEYVNSVLQKVAKGDRTGSIALDD